jgi:Immunoglobulin-like domain of bacterial spore germination/Sporulation and spore germination
MTRLRLAFAALGLLALLVAGCGGGKKQTQPEPTTTHEATVTAVPPGTTAQVPLHLRVYLLRDGKVAPVARAVAPTAGVAAAALNALGAGPTDAERAQGLTTEVPPSPSFDVALNDGVLKVDGADGFSRAALAQVVYTATQFPGVRKVEVGGETLTRASVESETPAILVETPLPDTTVTGPLRVAGTANTFEATFMIQVFVEGKKVYDHFATATSGSGTRGTYDVSIRIPGTGAGKLVVFESSAENGQPLHQVEIPLRFA